MEQELEPNVWVTIAFAARFFNLGKSKYRTNELKLLALVWECEHFRTYLLGNNLSFSPITKLLFRHSMIPCGLEIVFLRHGRHW